MTKVTTGNVVKVDYLGTTDGKVFDTSIEAEAKKGGVYNEQRPYEPLQFEVGAGQMIPGFDKAVQGMEVGEEKTVDLKPADAYGEYNAEMIKDLPLEQMKKSGIEPEVGQQLVLATPQGQVVGTVKAVEGETVKMDFNHELAGKTLTFKIIVKEIVS